jgi:hypothetical protein
MTNWPELEAGSTILYEHDDEYCPQRLVLTRDPSGGYGIHAVVNYTAGCPAPSLTRETVIAIANKLLAEMRCQTSKVMKPEE